MSCVFLTHPASSCLPSPLSLALQIMDHSSPVQWSDIAGLERAKKTVTEAVIWPLQRP